PSRLVGSKTSEIDAAATHRRIVSAVCATALPRKKKKRPWLAGLRPTVMTASRLGVRSRGHDPLERPDQHFQFAGERDAGGRSGEFDTRRPGDAVFFDSHASILQRPREMVDLTAIGLALPDGVQAIAFREEIVER